MERMIKQHLERYPDMQIQDIAKLLYQSEFGGGHMISDRMQSLSRLRQEYESVDPDILRMQPQVESIGNGISRIYLSALDHGLALDVLNEMFVQSANLKKGTYTGLQEKIALFLDMCRENEYSFSLADAEQFFEKWKLQGYPPISHSSSYRSAYHPAYRVVDDSYIRILDILPQVHPDRQHSFLIAIDGMSGSGKSTLGKLLHMNFPDSNLFHMDHFFLRPCQRTLERLSEIGGNVDYERFKEEILDHINDQNGICYRPYNCHTGQFDAEIHVPWKPLTIIEGSYSQHPYFEDIFDLKIFCKISAEEQKSRILKRNGEQLWKRFEQEWIPKENLYFKTFHLC